ncbi:hypothetical protein GAYE_SCF24G4367 [Galdieria yellowstonensis]|uniref:3-oxo-5-alpha-steroid 4-dehydrogenase C-terminal domain-containing protein n=1 Tax=Galdieria yellowstonensis TaxID=3028027 RepID=A0AAV9IGT4_9RHOD|nr:hypothetical protein GAYE_SCF24G4367 [Galdieria yellowstonensis]
MISYGRVLDSLERENDMSWNDNGVIPKWLYDVIVSPRIDYRTGFCSFYAIGCIVSLGLLCYRPHNCISSRWKEQDCLPLLLFLLHTSRRLYETLYVHIYSKRRMHSLHWLAGASYYLLTALTFGGLPTKEPCYCGNRFSSRKWFVLCVFVASKVQQYDCHRHLAQGRRDGNHKERYFIPYRGLFRYMTCPHYLLEMIIYGCLVLCVGCTRNSLVNFCFVVLNLSSRWVDTRRWYANYFGRHVGFR